MTKIETWILKQIEFVFEFVLRLYVGPESSHLTRAEQSDLNYRTLVFACCLNFTIFALGIAFFRRLVIHSAPLASLWITLLQVAIFLGINFILLARKRMGRLDRVFITIFLIFPNLRLLLYGFEPISAGVHSYMTMVGIATIGNIAGVWIILINSTVAFVTFLLGIGTDASLANCLVTVTTPLAICIPLMILRYYYDKRLQAVVAYEKEAMSVKIIQRLSHEINNPLAILTGLLQQKFENFPEKDRLAFHRNIQRIGDVVKQIEKYGDHSSIAKLVEDHQNEISISTVIEQAKSGQAPGSPNPTVNSTSRDRP